MAGQGQVILLEGEAGIGKSRLLAEAILEVPLTPPSSPFLSLQGRCFEPEQTCPYAPLAEMLRNWPLDFPVEPGSQVSQLARLLA